MIATLFVAALSSPTGAGGTALTVDRNPHPRAPLVVALFANRPAAERHLVQAARAEWDEELRYGLGPAGEWPDERLLARMREAGYLATVTEQVVEL